MTDNSGYSQLEKKYSKKVVYLLTGGLEYQVERLGGYCLGFSARATEGDALLVIRVDFEGRHMVGFVGAATLAGGLCILHDKLRDNEMKWQDDKYAKERREIVG